MDTGQAVLIEKKFGVAWLTINRPEKRNCLNMAVALEMMRHLQDCSADDDVKAVIISSAGGVAFCAGNDLAEFKSRFNEPARHREFQETVMHMHEAIRTFPKVTVAVVDGFCLGGGITLVASCDLAMASDASEFGLPEVRMGTFPALATTALMQTIARKHALRLILTGKNVGADEAFAMGLVSQVVPRSKIDSAAEEFARTLGGYRLDVLTLAKKMSFDALHMEYGRSMEHGLLGARNFAAVTKSWQQGVGEFLDKSQPR